MQNQAIVQKMVAQQIQPPMVASTITPPLQVAPRGQGQVKEATKTTEGTNESVNMPAVQKTNVKDILEVCKFTTTDKINISHYPAFFKHSISHIRAQVAQAFQPQVRRTALALNLAEFKRSNTSSGNSNSTNR